jgi:D-alanine transaminase
MDQPAGETRYRPVMPDRPTHAWFHGRLVPFDEARIPLDDRGLQFGESLYEVVAITAGKPRLLAEHVARMSVAAAELGLAPGVPSLAEWESLTALLTGTEGAGESLLYAQVTGGATPRHFVPREPPAPTFFAYVTPFRFPRAEHVSRGVRAKTVADKRWLRRDLKTTMLLPAVLAKREAARHGAEEAFLLGQDDELNEGGSSNVYVVEGKSLVTPAQSNRLLPGTTRRLVGSVADDAGLDVQQGRIDRERLLAADEVFITSTSQLVMPVIAIDGHPVGAGSAGPVACDLAARIRLRYELS